jgi:hypothetical protein
MKIIKTTEEMDNETNYNVIKKEKDPITVSTDISCPFCQEESFDLAGLKSHLERGDCESYNNIKILQRLW